jgi:hypothetical protein
LAKVLDGGVPIMPRFVILEHDHPHLHWDLMLETGNVLRSWRLEKPPLDQELIIATAIGDHRIAYLDYEGPVSNNRGTVKRWDSGNFEGDALGNEQVYVQVKGSKLQGRLKLKHRSGNEWEMKYFEDAGFYS